MSSTVWVYTAYALAASMAFWRLDPRRAVLVVWLGGWLLLPVGAYPPGTTGFTIELIGGALPSPMWLTKAWVAPVAALIGGMVRDVGGVSRWRPRAIDLPILGWCLLPLLQGLANGGSSPLALAASAYLLGSWGAPWLLGRLFFADDEGRIALLKALAIAALPLVPLALVELVARPILYEAVYRPHPFATDGAVRYVGFRPQIFFEHGNQYGMWIAAAALAAVAACAVDADRRWRVVAAVLVAAALISQSAGGILLLMLGCALLWLRMRVRAVRPALIGAAALIAVAAPVYASGVIPVERLVRHTAVGQQLLAAIRATGRGSIAWRVSQDQKAAQLVRERPVSGWGRWDWWRPLGARPWGLALLIVGQFGLIGLLFAGASMLWPVARLWLARSPPARADWALGVIVVMALIDALLNAFVLLPTIVLAGALGTAARRGQPA